MNRIRVETIIQIDGEVHLSDVPCRKGDRVEAVLFVPDRECEDERRQAKQRFLERARSSTFRSEGPYPTRDELHERA